MIRGLTLVLTLALSLWSCGRSSSGPDWQVQRQNPEAPKAPKAELPLPSVEQGEPTLHASEPKALARPEPLIPEVLPPLTKDSPLLQQDLAPVDRLCQDEKFGQQGLEACALLPSDRTVSRYASLTLQFSLARADGGELLPRKAMEAAFSLEAPDGTLVAGSLVWKDKRTLIFDPYEALLPDTLYRLNLRSRPGDPSRPVSSQGRLMVPLAMRVRTAPSFSLTQSLASYPLDSVQGLVLDQRLVPQPILQYTVDPASYLESLSLRRLGESRSLELCRKPCPGGSQNLDLNAYKDLQPKSGLNAYQWVLEGPGGSKSYRQFSFHWGIAAEHPESPISGGLAVALSQDNGLKAFSELLSRFASGQFTLDYVAPDGARTPKQTFNQIMNLKQGQYPQDIPSGCSAESPSRFAFLENLGPFCGLKVSGQSPLLGGLVGAVQYRASADIYVSSMQIEEAEQNVVAGLEPTESSMLVRLGVKRFRGTLKVVLHIEDARYLLGLPVPGATGMFAFDTGFSMAGPLREALAKTDIQQQDGRLQMQIRGLSQVDLNQNLFEKPAQDALFDTRTWNQNVTVSKVKQIDAEGGVWASVVNWVVNQAVSAKVEDFKPQIVNGVARDMIQIVAPQSLNTLVTQLDQGLSVPLPYYLPKALAQSKAIVAGNLVGPIALRQGAQQRFLQTALKAKIDLETSMPSAEPLPTRGRASYLRERAENFSGVAIADETLKGSGNLVSLHIDVLNQALFRLWQKGLLNLTVDKEFTRMIERFAVFDPARQKNGKEILLAEFIPKLLGTGIDRIQAQTAAGATLIVGREDPIHLRLDPRLPPRLVVQRTPDGEPRFMLTLGEAYVHIEGEHEGKPYVLARMRLAMQASTQIRFGAYSNPRKLKAFVGAGSLRMEISKDAGDLDHFVEILEDRESNPFGLDLPKLRDTVQPMVEDLFIPLFNDALRELPLVGLRSCGLELDLAQTAFVPQKDRDVLSLRAFLKTYPYRGHCALQPDYETPPEPLPDVGDDPVRPDRPETNGGGTDASAGEPVKRDLAFDLARIPLKLGDTGKVPEVANECQKQVFFDVSCAVAQVIYLQKDGQPVLDDRGRPVYDHTQINLYTLVPKANYALRVGAVPSVEAQFFAFQNWPEYAQGFEDQLVFKDSIAMKPQETQYGLFKRHYVDYETNSPKASGFIPIRSVSLHRVLPKPFAGALVSTEFFADLSPDVVVPEGKAPLHGAEGLDYHVGNIHILDCGSLDWCHDSDQWLVIYDSKLRPEDKSIPEEVLPYLKAALNSILAGMFP